MTTHAIETQYAGHVFRSRLEARWAAAFDLAGWSWTYEPIDCDFYVPDYTLHGEREVLAEVRPATTYDELLEHAERVERGLSEGCWRGDYLVVGARVGWERSDHCFPGLGVLGEYGDAGWDAAPALWHRCTACGALAFHHEDGSWMSRPCGCYDGAAFLGCVGLTEISEAWGEAHRRTRWTR
jgi:hypothetical protein